MIVCHHVLVLQSMLAHKTVASWKRGCLQLSKLSTKFKTFLTRLLLMMHSVTTFILGQQAASVRELITRKYIATYFRNLIVQDYIHACIKIEYQSFRSLTGGSGQQCCYDHSGNIIVGPPGGGTVDQVSPNVSTTKHFFRDVLPFFLCCKAGLFSNCRRYYQSRPSDDCSRFVPPSLPGLINIHWETLY